MRGIGHHDEEQEFSLVLDKSQAKKVGEMSSQGLGGQRPKKENKTDGHPL